MRVAALTALSLAVSGAGLAAAAICPTTGEPAPSVITVIASMTVPTADAWIVKPDCTVVTVKFSRLVGANPLRVLWMQSMGIERVESLPLDVQRVELEGNPLSKGANFTSARELHTVWMTPTVADNFLFPDSVTGIEISGDSLSSVSIVLPPGLLELSITGTAISSLKGLALPLSLGKIDLSQNRLNSLEGLVFPAGLKKLYLNDNQLTSLNGVTFPTKMDDLFIFNNKLSTLGCVFPQEIDELRLYGNQLTTLEDALFPDSCKYLKLNNNKLTKLDCIFPFTTLNLDLSGNQLTTLRGAVLPTTSREIKITDNNLTSIGSRLPSDLETLLLGNNQLSSIKGMALPERMTSLDLQSNNIQTIDAPFPFLLTLLNLFGNQIKSTKSVSVLGSLKFLDLRYNLLTSIDGALPRDIEILYISNMTLMALDTFLPLTLRSIELVLNPLPILELVAIPDGIEYIDLSASNVTTVRGVRWGSRYFYLWMCYDGCGEVSFEIRRSDLPSFTDNAVVFEGSFLQNDCSDEEAELVAVGANNFCVISDDSFDELYPSIEEIEIGSDYFFYLPTDYGVEIPPELPATEIPPETQPPSTPEVPQDNATHSSSGSGSSSSSGSTDEDIDVSSLATVPRTTTPVRSPRTTEVPEPSENDESTASADDATSGSGPRGTKKNPKAGKPSAALKSNSTDAGDDADSPSSSVPFAASTLSENVLPIVVVSVCAAFVLLACVCVYRWIVVRRPKKTPGADGGVYSSLESPTTGPTTTDPAANMFLANDVRNDERLMAFRLDESLVQLGDEIARSGSGVVYRGISQGRDVVVKQVVTSTGDSDAVLTSFMNEIRICASLDHPKIVAFVGFAWRSRQFLSAVVECMALGDLYTILQQEETGPAPEHWSAPWTTNKINSKASIAQDVAEAVVYLHSLQTPVIHRDLKTRNVLLDTQGNAKLSGFSISRETSFDETMTREIGSAAWMAPEVLRGERYDEKADIYSFGVLLVELDRVCHPYADEAALSTADSVVVANMEMARLVSEGQLRPSVSSACPESIASLAAECLHFEADHRPTALEVAHAIRQIRKAIE